MHNIRCGKAQDTPRIRSAVPNSRPDSFRVLIALQNWNTGIYLKKQEKSVLLEIKRNIETNILETNLDTSKIDEQVGSFEIITSHLGADIPFHDSISGYYNRIYRCRFFNGVTFGIRDLEESASNFHEQ